MSLRWAALIAGIAYLLMPVAYAEFSIWPRLVVSGDAEQTVRNLSAHGGLFAAAILIYLITFIEDLVIAWALYVLLAPVNRSLSLLTAWFRVLYTAMALYAWLNLVNAFRVLNAPDSLALFGPGPLRAEVMLRLHAFRWDFSISLFIFAIHLVLLGVLVIRCRYIPSILGYLLVLDGLYWGVQTLQPYLYPKADFGPLFYFSFVELLLPLWLVIRGWKITEPAD